MHDYQRREVLPFIDKHCGLFWKPGLGKTISTLFLVADKPRVLIVAPLRCCKHVWPAEIQKWLGHTDYRIMHGARKRLVDDVQFHIINYEGLAWLKAQGKLEPGYYDAIIFDESSKIKSPGTKRWRMLRSWKKANLTDQFILLTGSPASNGLMNLWTQIFMIDGGEALCKSMFQFKSRYFIQMDFQGWEYKCRDPEEIYDRLRSKVSFLTPEHPGVELELPELTVLPYHVEMASYDMDEYKKFARDSVHGEITAVSAGVLAGKLRQFANGWLYEEDKQVQVIHQEKRRALDSLMEEVSGPVIIVYEFKADRIMLEDMFPEAVVLAEEDDAESRWNKGDIDVLLLQPESAGYGLNLQASGNTIIWYGPPWNLEHWEQTIGRIWRQGQEANHVLVHVLTCLGTIDERIVEVLQKKDATQTDLMNCLLPVLPPS